MDFQRACQLYLWALPIVGVARWRQAYRGTFDLADNEIVLVNTFQYRLGVLTLNESTPYMFGFTNAERPVVFDEPSFEIIDAADRNAGMMHQPRGLAFWRLPHEVLQEEPVADRDRFFIYWLTHLGIEKGKRFDPETRQRAILEEAAFVGESMAQAMVYDERHPGVLMYEGWRMVLGGERGDGIHETQRMEHWDNRTRTLIDTDQQAATVGSKTEGLRVNDDGSVDVQYGPEGPGAEWESNWVKTIPGRRFFVYFRLCGVEQPFFDKMWQLPLVAPSTSLRCDPIPYINRKREASP